jgi:hypothetical protein
MLDEVPLSHLAYGLADITLDFFKRGASVVQARYSLNRSEIHSNIGLTPEQFKQLTDMREPSYLPTDDIGTLP